METVGTCIIPLEIEGKIISTKFHILNQATNIPHDGLLGKEFFIEHSACIEYETNTVKLKEISKPLVVYSEETSSSNNLHLKARTEIIVKINILNPEIKEGIVPNTKIKEGVYLSRAFVKVNNNNEAYATILNTRTTDQTIEPITVRLEKASKQCFQIKSLEPRHKRKSIISNHLRLEHLNEEEKTSTVKICESYSDIFHLPGDYLSSTEAIEHKINTINENPIYTKTYRYPEIHKREVNKQVTDTLKQNIIRPSNSPWSSPLWVVPKKSDASGEKKWRVVIDYRKLNEVTVDDKYPIPNIEEILDQLGRSKYFTTLDLASGFHQIPLNDDDSKKTAFTTPFGHYEYTRMPFGLKNAPATFQRLMNTVLSGLQGLQCFVYLDDIVIHAASIQEHEIKLRKIFDRLRLNNLKLQPDKCEFLRREVVYLGHTISDVGVRPNPDKVQGINSFPIPKSTKDIKSFLGLVGYYRRFIKGFAKIAKPLTILLKKNQDFKWTNKEQEAFEKFKEILSTQPILQYPDFNSEFVLTTDASNFAIGAVLSQGEIGKDLPIAYASRTLNESELNYSVIEKELLAIVWSVKHFRPYLFGRKFTIVTDHRPLTWLFNCREPNSRLVRWRIKLEEYDYKIIYKKGSLNANADALSRNVYINVPSSDKSERIHPKSKEEIKKILVENHDSKLAGHCGFCKTYQRIKQRYYWKTMKNDIKNYIRSCKSCQVNKINFKPIKVPMEITTTSKQAFEKLAIDVMGPLPTTSEGNKFILTMQDDLTKYSYAEPIPNHEARTIASKISKFVTLFGIPKFILTDQGTDFTSNIIKNLMKLFKTNHIKSTPYHPQTNGALERSHLTLKEYLKHYINERQDDWDEFIPFAMYSFNSHTHTSTGYTPYELLFGKKPFIPNSLIRKSTLRKFIDKPFNKNYDDYISDLKEKIQISQKLARENLIKHKVKSKQYYDNKINIHDYKIGDLVYIKNNLTKIGINKKLSPKFKGPYEIKKISGNNVYLKIRNKLVTYHVNNTKPCSE